jgi:hypothetical protein
MSEYISIKKHGLPKHDMLCLVYNCKGWMRDVKAIFQHRNSIFLLDDPQYRPTIMLDVTHYYPIPGDPKDE